MNSDKRRCNTEAARLVYERPVLSIFAKAPVAGHVKTRLIPVLGEQGAADLHARLVRHSVAVAIASRVGPVQLWVDDPHHPTFGHLAAAFDIALCQQAPGGLGCRMAAAFEQTGRPMLLMGSDCPSITADHLKLAAQHLSQTPAVFLPAEDGGYGLVGLLHPQPALFQGVPWGSGSVMAATRVKLQQLNLAWSEPALIWDVDRPEDLDRLRREASLAEIVLNTIGLPQAELRYNQ